MQLVPSVVASPRRRTVNHLGSDGDPRGLALRHPFAALLLRFSQQPAIDGESRFMQVLDIGFILSSAAINFFAFLIQNPVSRKDAFHRQSFYVVLGIQLYTLLWFALRFFIRATDGWVIYDTVRTASVRYVTKHRGATFLIDLLVAIPLETILWDVRPDLVAGGLMLRHLLRFVPTWSLCWRGSNPLVIDRPLFMFLNVVCVAFVLVSCLAMSFSVTESGDKSILESTYWAFATVLTVGYGDIVASTVPSRWVSIVAMVVGSGVVSVVTAVATTWMARKDRLQQDLDEKKLLMDSMMKHYGVPWELQKTVIASFPALLDKSSDKAFEGLLEQLPDAVRLQLSGYCNLRLLKRISFFDDVADETGLLLADCLQPIFCMPGDLVIVAGEVGTEMYFLLHGCVQVYVENGDDDAEGITGQTVVIATLRGGTFLGEMALMTDEPRRANAVALELSELLVLSKVDFLRLKRDAPHMFDRFEAEVARRRGQRVTLSVNSTSSPRAEQPAPLAAAEVDVREERIEDEADAVCEQQPVDAAIAPP